MPKNIVVLADGTGQEGGKGAHLNTNIYKMLLSLEDRSRRQVVFYDPGVGTGWRRLTGNVAGAGISHNVQQAYRFIHDNYQDGDRIFLIGFSRGAATVRSLASFMDMFPDLPRSRPKLIRRAWKIYQTRAPAWQWWARRRLARYPDHGTGGRRWKRFLRRLFRQRGTTWNLTNPLDLMTALLPVRTRFEFRKRYGITWEQHVATLAEDAFDRSITDLPEMPDRDKEPLEYAAWWSLAEDAFAGSISNLPDEMPDRDKEPLEYAEWSTLNADVFQGYVLAKHVLRECTPEKDARAFMRAFKRTYRATHFINAASSHSPVGAWAFHFLGCFDTVTALGLPFPRLRTLLNRIPGLDVGFHSIELGRVKHAYHALALDDERALFKPEVWPEQDGAHQVWFSGMHTDVGGGYLERGLSDIPLAWMLQMGHRHGLLLARNSQTKIAEDPLGVMHDSMDTILKRLAFGTRVRSPLENGATPIIHESVLARARAEEVWEWRRGGPQKVSTASYRERLRRALGNDFDGESGRYEVEPMAPFDRGKLVDEQNRMWDE